MSSYGILVFLHIVGSVGLFAAIGLEWAGHYNLGRSLTFANARQWLRFLAPIPLVGIPSMVTVLVTGIAMMSTRWGAQPWMAVSFLAMIAIAVLGGAGSQRQLKRLAGAVGTEQGPISRAVAELLEDRVLAASTWVRTALALGIVFLMTVKPGAVGSSVVMGVALALGLVAAWEPWRRGRRPALEEVRRTDVM